MNNRIVQLCARTVTFWCLLVIPVLLFWKWISEHQQLIGYVALPFIVVAAVVFWERIVVVFQPVIEDDLRALRAGKFRIYYSHFYLNCQGIGVDVPYLEIGVSILNATSFPISIEGFGNGLMKIEDVECKDSPELKEKGKVVSIEHAVSQSITIKQWISKDQAELIRKLGQSNDNHGDIRVFLNNCQLIVRPQIPGRKLDSMTVIIGESLLIPCNGLIQH